MYGCVVSVETVCERVSEDVLKGCVRVCSETVLRICVGWYVERVCHQASLGDFQGSSRRSLGGALVGLYELPLPSLLLQDL